MRLWKLGLFLLYVFVGAYFINSSLGIYSLPDVVEDFESLILLLGGALIVFHGLFFLRPRRKLVAR